MIEKLAKTAEVIDTKVKEAAESIKNFDFDKRLEKKTDIEKPKTEYGLGEKIDVDRRAEKIDSPEKRYTTLEERINCTLVEDEKANWIDGMGNKGNRGDSICIPTETIMINRLAEFGQKGIEFIKGEAIFSKVAIETVTIPNMSSLRLGKGGNFEQANNELAEQFNKRKQDGRDDWTARDVEEWRIDNKLTWHECCDRKTMQLVPTDIHKYFSHSGGVAECKARDGGRTVFDE